MDWLRHVIALGIYGALYNVFGSFNPPVWLDSAPFMDAKLKYQMKRYLEALEFGSGQDYQS